MRRSSRFRVTAAKASALVAAVALGAGLVVSVNADDTNATTLVAADAETHLADVVTNGTTVRYSGLTVRIPAAGQGISADALSGSGGDYGLKVTRTEDGKIVVDAHSHGEKAAEKAAAQAARPTALRASSTKTCTDGSFSLAGWKLPSLNWYYNGAGAPAAIAGTAGSAITNATAALSRTCGQRKTINLGIRFAGRSSAAPQAGAAGNCVGNDNRNVIGWRAGSGRWLGMTCTYFKTVNGRKVVTGTDTALNTRYKFFTSAAANCSNAYDLASVVLHERGHSLGLNHVDQHAHASAVMTPALPACSVAKRTLGLGDYRGLAAVYGVW